MADAEPADVFLSGLLFYDLVFTGLEKPPTLGAEIWTDQMGAGPGGIANFAVALRRLGARTSLAAAFGADANGDLCWDTLSAGEGVDLSASRRFAGWSTPVTVSLAYGDDRALVTHGTPPPVTADELIGLPPPSRATMVHIGPWEQDWLARSHAQGSLVFADVGWDPSEEWSPDVLRQLTYCHAFLPNAMEAMHYTGASTPAGALHRLADLVPVAVITCGAEGALAVDGTTGESASVPGVSIPALDTTGAGDVFGAGFIVATLAGWPLADRLRFANLTAALSVRRLGGAPAAPTWADIAAWWRSTGDTEYGFLEPAIAEREG
jgi:sugar/nucleoside kinase (ribokinase family)